MTCIVGIVDHGNVFLGGDRAAVADRHYLTHCAQPKVFRRGSFVMGYTSSFRMGQLLQYRLAAPDLPTETDFDEFMATTFADAVRWCLKDGGYTKIENAREEVGTFLVGAAGRLYVFDDDYNVRSPLCGYAACGSGESVALGSLHATAQLDVPAARRAVMALDAASRFVTTVRAPFDLIVDPAPDEVEAA
jgi:hypothetical protein